MGKLRKRLSILLIAAFVLACIPNFPARAEETPYTYTVRFYSGQQGTFSNGEEVIVYEGLPYGSVVTFNASNGSVILKDSSKYYIKGIRESGRDNNTVSKSSFVVTGDRDYVVAYGLRGNMVAYTVYYVDVNGNILSPTETYYGNVGDKPVVAFTYIEGYQPQAYNLTKTLVQNEAENVFTFVYLPLSAGNRGTAGTTTTVRPPRVTTEEVIEGPTVSENDINQYIEDVTEPPSLNLTDYLADRDFLMNDPFESIDLDSADIDGVYLEDTIVPLAEMKVNLGPIEVDARMLLIMVVILISVSIIALASLWYWRPYRKKEEKKENEK